MTGLQPERGEEEEAYRRRKYLKLGVDKNSKGYQNGKAG